MCLRGSISMGKKAISASRVTFIGLLIRVENRLEWGLRSQFMTLEDCILQGTIYHVTQSWLSHASLRDVTFVDLANNICFPFHRNGIFNAMYRSAGKGEVFFGIANRVGGER